MLTNIIDTAETLNVNKMLHQKCGLRVLVAAGMLALTTSTFAAELPGATATTYVDSVHEWGAWEFGLQPAAGGTAPSPQRAVAARNANVKFRPNDNSAYSPGSRAVTQTTVRPAPLPPPVTNTPGAPIPGSTPSDRWL